MSSSDKLLLDEENEKKESMTSIWRQRKRRRKSALIPRKLQIFMVVWVILNIVVILVGYKRLAHTFKDAHHLMEYLRPGGELLNRAPFPMLEPEAIAPLGAYVMILGYLLSILLIFLFVCLPFDKDMVRLKRSLFRWLLVDFLLIFFVVIITFSGAFAVIVHDRAHHHVIQDYWQRLFWNIALVMSPLLVLSFHAMFWNQAYIIYRSIDETKHLVFAIKM